MFMNFVHAALPTIIAALSLLSNTMIVVFFVLKFWPKKIVVSRGSFWVFGKDANAQNLTNLVSANLYGGGQISVEDRKVILDRTNSLKWGFVKNEIPVAPASNGPVPATKPAETVAK